MVLTNKHNIETIRGRFLIGRAYQPGIQWVRSYEELDAALRRLISAFEKEDDGTTLWNFHVMLIRHDGGWIEDYIFIDPDSRQVDEAVFDICRKEIALSMERMRFGNVKTECPFDPAACPRHREMVRAARSTAPRGPSPSADPIETESA